MRTSAIVLVAGLATASAASAQTLSSFTLNSGVFRYHENTITGATTRTGTGGGSANFGFASGAATATSVTSDYLFQNWWWYRSAGDAREFALSNQSQAQVNFSGDGADLRYLEPIGSNPTAPGLQFDLSYNLQQITPTQATCTINWNITNLTQESQTLTFFSYGDADVLASSGNVGTYNVGGAVNYLRADASTTNNAQFFTMAADLRLNDSWGVQGFGPRFGLTDADIDNLPNTVTPFTGDYTGAFGYELTIAPGATVGGRVTKGYNYVVPAPGAVALLGLGGLVAGRRRR